MENQYIHIGIGSPGFRSYSLGICKTFTSTCLRDHRIRSNVDVYVAKVVGDVFEKFRWNLEELKEPFHTYKSRDRVYLVYRYSDDLYKLIKSIFDLAIFINSYKWTQKNKWIVVNGILAECNDVESCINVIDKRVKEIREYLKKLRKAGKKALLTRLIRNTIRCRSIVDKYFNDLYNYPVFDAYSVFYDTCMDKAVNILSKFYGSDVSRRYSDGMCRRNSSIYLFARDSIFAVKTSNTDEYFRLFYDSCVETDKYVAVKLIGVSLVDNYVDRIDWVALLGYDKNTNQVFLHYVPKTLVFRDAEVCRRWIMGLADEYGRTIEDIELIEV